MRRTSGYLRSMELQDDGDGLTLGDVAQDCLAQISLCETGK
jgi:hypothetical protein